MTTVLEIHPSDVNAALLCAHRLIDDGATPRPSYDLMRGQMVHDFVGFGIHDVTADPSDLLRTYLVDEYGYTSVEDFPFQRALEKLTTEALTAMLDWQLNVRPMLNLREPFTVEHERTATIFVDEELDIEVELIGTPDFVDAKSTIYDWKTARRFWEINKPPGQMQPPLYSHLVASAPCRFEFWIYSYGSKDGYWERMDPITPTFSQMDQALDMAAKLAMARHFNVLVPSPGYPPAFGKITRNWWCSPKFCHRWNSCEARKLVNDGGDDVEARWENEWEEANAG